MNEAEPDWEAIQIELEKKHIRDENAPLERLKPNPKNPRHHPESLITQLEESMKRFGRVSPMIVDEDYNIIAGHARYKAASNIGLKTFPVRVFKFDKHDSNLYMLADNRLNELSEWNMVLLEPQFLELKDAGVGLEGTGFTNEDMDNMLIGIDFGVPDFDMNESIGGEPTKKPFKVICPKCGEEFEVDSKTKV